MGGLTLIVRKFFAGLTHHRDHKNGLVSARLSILDTPRYEDLTVKIRSICSSNMANDEL